MEEIFLNIFYNGTNITECVPNGINYIEYLYQQTESVALFITKFPWKLLFRGNKYMLIP